MTNRQKRAAKKRARHYLDETMRGEHAVIGTLPVVITPVPNNPKPGFFARLLKR